MTNISWSQFEKNQLAKDISFESFCFQVAYIKYKEYGFFENFYNTPGSEFYLLLHKDCPELNLKAGDKIGWQVKWWFNSEDNSSLDADHKKKLTENFTTTLRYHADIKTWIICTPGGFVEREFKKLKADLKKLSSQTGIIHWNKATFANFLSSDFEKFGNVFKHYFDWDFIGFNFLKKYSQRRIEDLKKKFDTDLYTPSHYDDEILFLIDYKKIYAEFETQIKYLQDDVDEIERDDSYTKSDYKSFTKEYISKAYELLYLSVKISKRVIEVISSKMNTEKAKMLYSELQNYIDEYRVLGDFLNKKINSNEHLTTEGGAEHHIEDWQHKQYLIASINKIQNQLISKRQEDKEGKTILDLLENLFQRDLHILSSAGYGKTNIACNICNSCLEKEIPCLLILGSEFRKSELPQTMILEQLGIKGEYTFKEFLHSLDNLGFSKGYKIPIIVDGLNESTPYDAIWKTHIKDIIRDIYELQNVIFITTCRDRYIESIFEETDISKIQNTKTLVGLSDKVREVAIRKYFQKYEIVPSSWNFKKDLFQNPLLLKIFSEVNEKRKNIHISLENVFSSIDTYINLIEERASIVSSTSDPILRKKIKNGIENFCLALWTANKREISLDEFHKIIDPASPSLTGSLTEKLLDEGLCFQRNLTTQNETVQFTYDLVGGYSIASKALLKSVFTKDEITLKFDELGINEKLFNKETEHPLRQDILMSLLHLIPAKFGINLFELYNNEMVTEECFNSVDYFTGNEEGQEKLLDNILKENRGGRNFKLLFEKLFENTFKKDVHGLGSFTIRVLKILNQAEIDIYWTELVRKNVAVVYPILYRTNKNYLRNKSERSKVQQDLHLSFLSTTSSDKSIRSISTENLFLIAKKHPEELLKLGKEILSVQDINSTESLILSICGSVLALKSKTHTIASLEFITKDFLPNFASTHIGIIDYVQTIAEFAHVNFQTDYSKQIVFDKGNFKSTKDKEVIKSLRNGHSLHFPHLFGLDLYDFNKHQIAGIATDSYDKRKTFSSIECLAIISDNIKKKGYDENTFTEISKEFQDDNRYKYGRGQNDNLVLYQEKYLWQSYFELVGYLVLSKKLKSEDKNRFRCDYNFFDPTFPRLPQRFQLITECFFPAKDDDIQEWINSEKDNFVDDFLIHNLNTKSEWVLLSATINQEGSENDTRFNLSLYGFLIAPDRIKDFQKKVDERGYYEGSTSFGNLFAGEIAWSNFAQRTEDGYYGNYWGLITMMYEYSWTGWSSNRFKNPYFEFLNPQLANSIELTFNTTDLSFYDMEGNQATKIVWVESCKLYYIRKDVLEKIINKQDLELVWFQFVSKYGEYGKHNEHTLNPTFGDVRRLITYSTIKKVKE